MKIDRFLLKYLKWIFFCVSFFLFFFCASWLTIYLFVFKFIFQRIFFIFGFFIISIHFYHEKVRQSALGSISIDFLLNSFFALFSSSSLYSSFLFFFYYFACVDLFASRTNLKAQNWIKSERDRSHLLNEWEE